jgi:hypothetical protein
MTSRRARSSTMRPDYTPLFRYDASICRVFASEQELREGKPNCMPAPVTSRITGRERRGDTVAHRGRKES